ncbi:hypothetical protein MLD38_007942 [Melastoma candidum]|uniref:Uncharacterized protein n=1 Tax=Melastoma candidum TaxID=119954 RepID=A0ACB9RSX0_9MYRT|nr:hypothetical protein MLD38_007942 [Melastoma candidum]
MQAMNEAEDACSYTGSLLKFVKKLGPGIGFEFRSSGGGSSISSFSPRKDDMGVLEIAGEMKELAFMDSADVDWILDLEEALHCYSLITCPFYLDLVRKFFMEIYSDFTSARNSMSLAGPRCE